MYGVEKDLEVKTMKTTKTKSSQARAAACIRKELKAAFPETKFSVTSSSFSMGDSVDINWENGPTTEQVDKISKKYQYGHFDGMYDIYEYSNSRKDIPQSKYVMTQRRTSDDLRLKVVKVVADAQGHKAPETVEQLSGSLPDNLKYGGCWNWYDIAHQVLCKMDLTGVTDFEEDKAWECGDHFSYVMGVKA